MSETRTPRHPVLRIKKGAERDTEYHYNREERLSKHYSARAPSPSNPLSFFRRGRLPGLLPVLLIALIGLALFRFFPRAANRGTIAGFEATLRVMIYDQTLLTSVTFEKKAATSDESLPQIALVEFSVPDAGLSLTVTGELSRSPITLRGTMDLSQGTGAPAAPTPGAPVAPTPGAPVAPTPGAPAAARTVTALVSVGNESRSLSQAIPKP